MKLKEKYERTRLEQKMVWKREELIIKKIVDTEFSVPGEFSTDNIGKYLLRAFFYPSDPKDVKTLAREVGELFGIAWKLSFRKTSGKFFYFARKEDYFGESQNLVIMIEEVPAPANCKIVEKEVKVKLFEKICNEKV